MPQKKIDGARIPVLVAAKTKEDLDVLKAKRRLPAHSVSGRKFFEALAAGDPDAIAIANKK